MKIQKKKFNRWLDKKELEEMKLTEQKSFLSRWFLAQFSFFVAN